MCKRSFLLSLAVLAGLVTAAAWADIAPRPHPQPKPRPGGVTYNTWFRPRPSASHMVVLPALPQTSPPIAPDPSVDTPAAKIADVPMEELEPDVRVAMQNGEVRIKVSKLAAKPAAQPDQKPARQLVVADVDCSFDLQRLDEGIKPDNFTMSLPIGEQDLVDTRGIKCTSFSVTVDGQSPKWIKKEQLHIGGVWFYGYSWPATIQKAARQKVSVKYVLQMPVRNGTAQFTYALRSGALWDGPIDRETVRIASEPGITLKAKPSKSLAPAEQDSRKIAWELRNAEPKDDIHVDVRVGDGQ